LTILRFQIEDLKEPIQRLSLDVILIGQKEGGENPPQKHFDNIKKNAGICNENLRKVII
jgi:hypothetical protein